MAFLPNPAGVNRAKPYDQLFERIQNSLNAEYPKAGKNVSRNLNKAPPVFDGNFAPSLLINPPAAVAPAVPALVMASAIAAPVNVLAPKRRIAPLVVPSNVANVMPEANNIFHPAIAPALPAGLPAALPNNFKVSKQLQGMKRSANRQANIKKPAVKAKKKVSFLPGLVAPGLAPKKSLKKAKSSQLQKLRNLVKGKPAKKPKAQCINGKKLISYYRKCN